MGIITKLISLVASKAGKTMGRSVMRDIDGQLPWSHADKIAELSTDVGLSKSYLTDLIAASYKKADLQGVQTYLVDIAKSNNLTDRDRYSLFTAALSKIKGMDNYEVFKEAVRHGADLVDHL